MADNAPHEGPRAANSVWRLLHEVKIDDLVVMPSKPRNQEYAIGRITGHYEFVSELTNSESVPHTLPVQWLKTQIQGELFAHLSLPPHGTIARLRSHEIENRIQEILA